MMNAAQKWIRRKMTPFNGLIVLFTLAFVIFFLFPFYWQLATSVRAPRFLTSIPPQIFPKPMFFQRYLSIFTTTQFPLNVRNSLLIASFTTVTCLSFSILSSYAIARLGIPGAQIIMITVLVISMFPGVSLLAPLYLTFKNFGIINTRLCLIVAYTAVYLPFTMWFLTSFFRTVPPDMEEAATIDGCTPLQSLFRIMIPLSAPAVFTVAMMIFIFSWNEFLFSFTFTTSNEMRTFPVGLYMFQGMWDVPWGDLCAGSTVVALPIVTLVLIAQRFVIQGLTAGAVKG
jgi:multiple sugar transport system permease protein